MQWPIVVGRARDNALNMRRRPALDLYGVKDVLLTHEQMKKTQPIGNSKSVRLFG